MDERKFKEIESRLNTVSDITKVHKRTGEDRKVLRLILNQKRARSTTRKYHTIRVNAGKYFRKWKNGQSFVELGLRENFSPLQLAFLVLNRSGVTRKQFRRYIERPERIENWRIRHELKDALKEDLTYSPEGTREQEKRGKDAEQKIKDWLDKKRIAHITEHETEKGEGKKTPDFHLKKPLAFQGMEIHWLESKASFGDRSQFTRDYRKQLSHYIKIFGPGLVVYWYGWVETKVPKGLKIAWKRDFGH